MEGYKRKKIQVTYKGKYIRTAADFSMETLKTSNAFQVLKNYESQPKTMYPTKPSAMVEGKENFPLQKQPIRIIFNKPNLEKTQEVLFQLKREMSIAERLWKEI